MLDLNPKARSEKAINAIPLKRIGMPQDVANLVRFLASDESSYISGAEISITGGM
jgi:NAD(P)-dependent dehydrogenase (short-subunit alcohol dehydrogenase family)